MESTLSIAQPPANQKIPVEGFDLTIGTAAKKGQEAKNSDPTCCPLHQ
jgi:hypothetical protein